MKAHLPKAILFFSVMLFLWPFSVLAEEVTRNSPTADPQAMTLTVTNMRYNSFTLSWTAHPDATKYKLWVKREVSGGWEVFTAYNGKEYGMTTLTTDIVGVESSWNSKRQVVIQAIRNTAVVEEATKNFDIPNPPQSFSLLYTPESTTISVEWNAFYDNYEYLVYAYKNTGGTLTPLSGYPTGFVFSQNHLPYTHKITGLALGTKYEITVKRKSYGSWCDTLHKVQYTSPAIPQIMAATDIKPNSFVANWKTTPVAPQYKLFVKESVSGKTVLNGLILNEQMSRKIENLEPGTQYEYQVTSLNPLGESEKSGVMKVFTTVLPVPVAISPSSVASTYFEARWNTLTNATGYLLQVSDGNVWTNYTISSGTTNTYLLTGMKPDFTYEYRVKAYFGTDYTQYSNVITLKTQNSPVAKAVSHFEDPTTVTLVWDPANGATGYRVYVISREGAANNPAGYFPKVLGNVLNHNMTGLKTGHSYQFYLDAITPSGNTTISNKFDFYTAPAVPVCLDPTEITATSFKARWQVFDEVDETYLSVFNSKSGAPVTGFNNKLVTGESATVTGLTFDTEYHFIVKVKKNGLNSFPSAWKYVSTDYVQLTLAATPTSGGTISGDGWKKLNSSVTINASPAKGYEFVNWTKGTTPVSTSQSYSFNITATTSLTANFKATTTTYTINLSANPSAGGTVSGGGSYASGSSVTIKAVPNAGYEFVDWTKDGVGYSESSILTISPITSNLTLVANFKATTTNYTVSVSANPTAAGTVTGGGSFISGKSVTVSAAPNTGYEFVNWTEKGLVISSTAAYTFILSSNRTLVANFKSKETDVLLTLSASPVIGGTVSGGGRFAPGTTVTISAAASKGYEFVNWTEGTKVVTTSLNYKFSITTNRTLTANFRAATGNYSLNLSSSPVAGGTTGGAGVFAPGSSVTATATANAGYSFVNWKEGATVVSTSASYTFTLNANRTLTANFQQNITGYTLSLQAGPEDGGTVTGGGAYAQGASVTARATANTGYEFVNWTEGTTVISTQPNYSFTLNGNRTLTANFEQVTPSYAVWLSASPATGGSVAGEGTFSQGSSVTVSATPAAGYDFAGWTEESVQVSLSADYTFTLNSSRVLVAYFTLKTPVKELNETEISMYPNPVSKVLNISGLNGKSTVSLITLSGARILARSGEGNTMQIDVRQLNKGFYLVSVESEGNRTLKKILVQ